jgi:hyperosmotically inducible protein
MRALLRAVLLIVVVVAVGFLLLGYWTGSRSAGVNTTQPPIGTTGTTSPVNVDRARERGAEIGEKAAVATKKAGEAVQEAALTTKIKAKMALDDSIKARAIDVTTDGSIVTLDGTVGSVTQRERAVALARETVGVTQVIDHLRIQP